MLKNKFIKRIWIFIISMVIVSSPIFERISMAEIGKTVIINSNSYDKKNNKIHIVGARFYIYKVGLYKNNRYILTDDFKKSRVDLNNNLAIVEMDTAKKLYEFANDKNIYGKLEITNSNGEAVFSGLSDGVYMIAQLNEVLAGNMIYKSAPFLVKSPSHFEGKNSIIVDPKYGIEEDKPDENPPGENNPPNTENPPGQNFPPNDGGTPNNPNKPGEDKPPGIVKTGDNGILSTVILFTVAFFLFIVINKRNKKTR